MKAGSRCRRSRSPILPLGSLALLVVACQLSPVPTLAIPSFAFEGISAHCYWPPGTFLAFEGWATLAQLGVADSQGRFGTDHWVYAIVSRDRISQPTNGGGPPIVGRGICWADENGLSMSTVPDNWVLNRSGSRAS